MLLQLFTHLRHFVVSIQKLFTFFPFQRYLIAFIFFLWLAYFWLNLQVSNEPSLFNDLLTVIIKLVKTVIIPLLLIGLTTVLIPFLMLWIAYRKRNLLITLESPAIQPDGMKQELKFSLSPVWQPLFGQIYYRLIYEKGNQKSPKFSLVRKENALGFAGNNQNGYYRWPLPGIREYEIDSMIIYLEDFFHFFKFALPVKVNQSFFTRPTSRASALLSIEPSKTASEDIRIKDLRKVSGELLNYKNFDSTDDVRRIVWKIYAKNKELVVRTAEILNPFASHVSVYVSFYDHLGVSENGAIKHSCLDFYKAACWTVYRQLENQGMKTLFFTDQPIPNPAPQAEGRQVEYALATGKWQNQKRIDEWINLKDATLICLSSLSRPEDVAYITNYASSSLTVAFVPLSAATPFPTGWNRLKWLWIETEKDPTYKDNLLWFVSATRRKMIENEKTIINLLNDSGIKYFRFGTAY